MGATAAATVFAGLRPVAELRAAPAKHQLFWGDLHNHNAVGYANLSTRDRVLPKCAVRRSISRPDDAGVADGDSGPVATARSGAYREDPTKAVVCDFEAKPDAELTVEVRTPATKTVTARVRDLVESNFVTLMGGFPSESFILERLVSPSESNARIRWQDRRERGAAADYYYVRVRQHNGHVAWASPVCVG